MAAAEPGPGKIIVSYYPSNVKPHQFIAGPTNSLPWP